MDNNQATNTTTTSGGGASEIDDFLSSITMPREEITAPPIMTGPDEPDDAPITDNDEQTIGLLNYEPEHRETALFFIGMIDNAMGMAGMFISGMPAEKYMKFAKTTPPEYYVNVTAALVKKYQARMSLETMFISALMMIYGPVIPAAMADRRKVEEQEERERQQAEIQRQAQIIANAKAAAKQAQQ
ncbi:hypothetical protein [Haliscomenobacter hydrossis]|uniref:Uncharacterized protein n=1 Tax=Haliscomenobacter hydrossis (strain ATCC 27775 / DSM 1100 / LMG 10767 / O) TaxID=760192 RepID=F4L072_HALH1|nr:hypothetical protein [Haliscomenobacter hydrossis]AEE53745.1 hypothetical protein Halhy_5922 [Haliscomenobacter hydrossis DSM 1100]